MVLVKALTGHALMLTSLWSIAHGLSVAKKYEPSIASGSKCQAQVVVDAGLARTGTSSFVEWMGSLGYQKYHRKDYFRSNGLQEAMRENRTGKIFNSMWQQKGNFVVADTPWPWLACGVAKSQPKRGTAKFILMERNAVDWHLSLLNLACMYIFQGSAPSSHNGVQDFCPKMLNGKINYTTPNAEMNIISVMTEGWCREAMSWKHPGTFCEVRQQQGANSQAFKKEHPTVAQYMKQHTQIVKACVPHEDLVVVDLYDEYQEKEMKMARFLGCHGDIPTFPTNVETGHDQYLDVVGNWMSEN